MYVANGEFRCPACGAPCRPTRFDTSMNRQPIRSVSNKMVGWTQGRAEGKVEFTCRSGCEFTITTGFEAFLNAVYNAIDRDYRGFYPYPAPEPKPVTDEAFPEWPEPEEREP